MKRLVLLLLLALPAFGQLQGPPQPFTGNMTSASASCLASNCLTVPVPSDASTATFQLSGTWSATVQFEVSAGGTCATPTVKTGAMALPVTSGQGLIVGAGHTLFSGTAGQDVCIVSAGTNPTVNGWVTLVLM